MTIATIEDLRALPDGTSVCVGTTAAQRAASTWVKHGDDFVLSGTSTRLDYTSFSHDVRNGRVQNAAGMVPEPGQTRRAGNRYHTILGPAVAGEGSGWRAVYTRESGDFIDVRTVAEPGDVVSMPWTTNLYTIGTQLVNEQRRAITAENSLAEANRRATTADARVVEAERAMRASVRSALEGVDLDEQVVQRLVALGVSLPHRARVTIRVQGTVQAEVPVEVIRGYVPEGASISTTATTTMQVQVRQDFTQEVETEESVCVCNRIDRTALDAEVRAAFPSISAWTLPATHCPHGSHAFIPEGFDASVIAPHPVTVGQALTTPEEFRSCPVGTVAQNMHGANWTKEERGNDACWRRGGIGDHYLDLSGYTNERWTVHSLPEPTRVSRPTAPAREVLVEVDQHLYENTGFPRGTTVAILPDVRYREGRTEILAVSMPPNTTGGWNVYQHEGLTQPLADYYAGRKAYWVLEDRVRQYLTEPEVATSKPEDEEDRSVPGYFFEVTMPEDRGTPQTASAYVPNQWLGDVVRVYPNVTSSDSILVTNSAGRGRGWVASPEVREQSQEVYDSLRDGDFRCWWTPRLYFENETRLGSLPWPS